MSLTKSDIKLVRSLKNKEGRAEHGLFVCEGRKLTGELLKSPFKVRRIFSVGGDANAPGVDVETVTKSEIERLSLLKTPTDILALVEIPEWQESPAGGLSIVLDGVQDPGNLGTIIRIADWFGIGTVYCSPDSADCFNPKVVQATMGSITRVKVLYRDPAELLAGTGLPVYGTFLDGDDIYDTELASEGFIVMGSEGRGISDDVGAYVTRKLFIPPFPPGSRTGESLNVAAATALVCAEFRRRAKT